MQASQLLMIEPVNFGFNPETAVNNSFQKNIKGDIQEKALLEFAGFVDILRKNGIGITVVKDTLEPSTPDSIFPNNWISFHSDNSIFLYPMFAINRRFERKEHVLRAIQEKFKTTAIHDLSHNEKHSLFLEGTGSMVLDHINKIAYASVSPRTDLKIVHQFCNISRYVPVSFSSKDKKGNDIYHTNVMMCIADSFVVICLEAIRDKTEREKLKTLFTKTNKEIINISFKQLNHFAGNMLQLKNHAGELLLAMSTRAYSSLSSKQLSRLQHYNRIIHSPLDSIETCGGGSARCMMAEIFNELK